MERTTRRPWLQFSVRSLLILMLAVGCFFAGRMSLQRELNRTRAIEQEFLQAQEAAAAAEQAVLHQFLLDQAQAALDQSSALRDRGPDLPLPKVLVEDTAAPSN